MVKSAGQYFCFPRLLNQNRNNLSTVTKEGFAYLSMIKRKSKITAKQDHLRMNVALDQTIILGQQIFLDHRSKNLDDTICLSFSPLVAGTGLWS